MPEEQKQNTVVTSELGRLSVRDLIQGMIMAGLGAGLAVLYPLIEAWTTGAEVAISIPLVVKASVGAAVLHLLRKLMSRPTVVITNASENVMQAVKSGEATVKVTSPETPTTVIKPEGNSDNQKSSI